MESVNENRELFSTVLLLAPFPAGCLEPSTELLLVCCGVGALGASLLQPEICAAGTAGIAGTPAPRPRFVVTTPTSLAETEHVAPLVTAAEPVTAPTPPTPT